MTKSDKSEPKASNGFVHRALSYLPIKQLSQLATRVQAPFIAFFSRPIVAASMSLIVFLVALRVINQELTKYTLEDLQRAVDGIERLTLLAAFLAAVLCYGALAFNDRFALALLGKRLPQARTARASIAANALSNTLGYSWATAGTARSRLYRKWGLLKNEIGALSFLTGTSAKIGGLFAAGLGLIITAPEFALHGPLDAPFWYFVGIIALIPGVSWLVYAKFGPPKADVSGGTLNRPTPRRAAAHIFTILLNWTGAAGILYILLPDHGGWSFPAFLAVYVLAGMLGAISGAPGGLGVFEAAILTLAPIGQDTPGAAVALLIYRLLYNVVPLGFAILIIGLDHAAPAARPAARAAKRVGSRVGTQWNESTHGFAPRLCAILVFMAGFGMLASIATPAFTARLDQLAALGLSAIAEATHVSAGIIGTLLLFVAASLWQGNKWSWSSAVGLVSAGAIISLAKGLAWEESSLLLGVLVALMLLRSSLRSTPQSAHTSLTPGWFAMIIGALATNIWIATFSYQNVDVSLRFIFDFARDNDAARTLRGFIAAFITCSCFIAWHFLRQRVLLTTPVEEAAEV